MYGAEREREREHTCGCFYATALLYRLGLQHHNSVTMKLQIKSTTNVICGHVHNETECRAYFQMDGDVQS